MATDAERLARPEHVSVVGPAGCGKTTLIAAAAAQSDGRQLILTHTHAGVAALRQKLRRAGVARASYEIHTICGWALRLAQSYPMMSGVKTTMPTAHEWADTYHAATDLLMSSTIRRVVQVSYRGAFVDEYQDCALGQHGLVLQLAEIMPVRVIGDPLQGIFSFQEEVVNWEQHVQPAFRHLMELRTPYRWQGKNECLGRWLLGLRDALLEDRPVRLDAAPVTWCSSDGRRCRTGCKGCRLCYANPKAALLHISESPRAAAAVARTVAGLQTIEEMQCQRLLDAAKAIDQSTNSCELDATLACLVKRCYARADKVWRSADVKRLRQALADQDRFAAIDAILEAVSGSKGPRLHNGDLWSELRRAVRLKIDHSEQYGTFHDAAWRAREITRYSGRSLPQRVASTVLRVKGLEFDHAIVGNAQAVRRHKNADPLLGAKNFYVAATRASTSLTVFCPQPVLDRWHSSPTLAEQLSLLD
ncbi:MAG: UvrD-helicase domain-containing protein [Anaerolineae bacterium]|jgi:superfamily I DNA/RNA helicase